MSINKGEWVLLGIAALSVLPFLMLALYWHPVGTHGFDWLSNWSGRFDGVSWFAQQKEWYTTTMGRYTSSGLLSTTSWWYTLGRARWTVAAMLLALPFALAYVLPNYISLNYRRSLGWGLVLTALWLSQLSNPYDSLYRWSGLLTYHSGLLLSLIYAGALCRRHFILAAITVALAVGTNEISLVHCGIITGAWWVLRPDIWKQPLSALVLVIAFLCAVAALSAPGNFNRSELYEAAGGYGDAAFLTVASSVYLWLGWLGSGMLILFAALVYLADLTAIKLSKTQFYLAIGLMIFIVPLSLAPVLLATKGDSLPEGITDWQIIPVLLLSLLIIPQLPKPKVNRKLAFLVGLALLLPALFGGLGIDRSRDIEGRSAVSRIIVSGKSGIAWLEVLSGSAAAYDAVIEQQYTAAIATTDTLIYLDPLPIYTETFLYDPSYDRRSSARGEVNFGYAVGKTKVVAKYSGE